MNTKENKEKRSAFSTLLANSVSWIGENSVEVIICLLLLVLSSHFCNEIDDFISDIICSLNFDIFGRIVAIVLFAFFVICMIYRICKMFKYKPNADPHSVCLSILLQIVLVRHFHLNDGIILQNDIATFWVKAAFGFVVILVFLRWILLPVIFYFINFTKQESFEKRHESSNYHDDTALDCDDINVNEDPLKYSGHVMKLKEMIENLSANKSHSIAITGAWGTGKTTFINRLKLELQNQKSDEYIFVYFEPMKSENEDSIQNDFFDTLESELSRYRLGMGRIFLRYKELLGLVDERFYNVISNLSTSDRNSQHERISKIISSLHRRVIVVIDDVDRLREGELYQVFRLVRFNANFKNVVFLLAMDKNKVEAELGKGGNFSDKFYETEFPLPKYDENVIYYYIIDGICKFFKIDVEEKKNMEFLPNIEEDNMQKLYNYKDVNNLKGITLHCIKTLRDAKRFLNYYNNRFEMLKYRCDTTTYYILSLIWCYSHEAYNEIKYREILSNDDDYLVLIERNSLDEQSMFKNDDILWAMAEQLFNRYVNFTDEKRSRPIYISKYFDFYFSDGDGTSNILDDVLSWLDKNGDEISEIISETLNKQDRLSLIKYWSNFDFTSIKDNDKKNRNFLFIRRLLGIDTNKFFDGRSLVKINNFYGYEDDKMNLVIPCKYEDGFDFLGGIAAVKLNGKYAFIDIEGKPVTDFLYDYVWQVEPIIIVCKDSLYGFVNDNRKFIDCIYERVGYYSEGLIAVRKNGKWGYIDKDGNEIIEFKYDKAEIFNDGSAVVELDGSKIKINKEGKQVSVINDSPASNQDDVTNSLQNVFNS